MSNLVEPEIAVDIAAAELTALTEDQRHQVDPLNSGFTWYTPPMASPTGEHEVHNGRNWTIAGHDMQVLSMTLPASEHVVTETGSFFFGSQDLQMDVELTLCRGGEGCQRICGGESCVKLILRNDGSNEGYVALTPNYPAKVIPVVFGKHLDEGNALITQGGAYMAHLGDGVEVGCDLDLGIKTCCCAGFGACRQKITGNSGDLTFLAAGGTLVYRNLAPGEQVIVDSRSVVAMEESVTLGITSNGRFCTCCFGGEGCCSTTLTGPGKIFMQSMNFKKFQEAVQVTVVDDRGAPAAGASTELTPQW